MRDTRDIVLRLYEILSRMGRENGDRNDMATLTDAATQIILLERELALVASELDALRTAKLLLEELGAQEAWRILTAQAIQEHISGDDRCRDITQQVLGALRKLTMEPDDKPRH